MKLKQLLLLPVIFVLGACSTTNAPTTDQVSNYKFDGMTTYALIGDKNLRNPLVSDIDRERIDNAINDALTTQGINATDQEAADITVSYYIVTNEKVKSYNHYGASRTVCKSCGPRTTVIQRNTRSYVEGTLVLDIYDNKAEKSVWRSSLTKTLKKSTTPEERDQAINEAVSTMLAELPIV